MPVHRQRRVRRLLGMQNPLDRGPRLRQIGVVERAFAEGRRKPGRDEQHIALAQRHLELVGQAQQHLAARLRAPGIQKAQVAGRDLGLAGQRQLAPAAVLPPVADQVADRLGVGRGEGGFHGRRHDSTGGVCVP